MISSSSWHVVIQWP